MAERFCALKLPLLFYAILLAGTNLRAQTITLSEDAIDGLGQAQAAKIASEQKIATPTPINDESGQLDYSPDGDQASASVYGATPSLKTPSPVHGLCWSDSNGYFSLTEQNALFIRDGFDSRLIHTIEYDGAVSLQFAWDVVTQSDMFMALSSGGKFSVWNFKDLPNQVAISSDIEPSYSYQFESERRVTASAFSHSGNHMAVAFDDGTVNLSIVLHYTQKLSDRELKGHLGNVFALDFSRDDKYLATSGLDDRIYIWDASGGRKIAFLPFYSGSGAGALFTKDSSEVISLERPDMITVRNFDGKRRLAIVPRGKSAKAIKLTSKGDRLVVLSDRDNLEFYDLQTGKYVGWIPPFNETSLTSFAFNRDDSVLLTGHADGSVYKLRLEKVFLKPNQKPPRMRAIGPDEVVMKGTAYKDTVGEEPDEKTKNNLIPKESALTINLGLAGRMMPSPYTAAVDIDAKARYQLNGMFYFGGGAAFGLGFPKKDFPYTYSVKGAKYDPPFFLSGTFYGAAGLLLNFKSKKAPYVFFELDPGLRIEKLYQSKNGSSVSTKWHTAFCADFTVGLGWKFFEFGAGVEFDTILGIKPRAIFSGKIPVPLKPKSGKKSEKKGAGA